MLNLNFLSSPWSPLASKQPLVRLQLPPGMGRSISVRGVTVEADADGYVEVPADAANEVRAHLPASDVETPTRDLKVLASKIKDLRSRIAAEVGRRDELRAAWNSAEQKFGVDAAPAVEPVPRKLRQAVADFLTGTAKAADITAVEAEARAVASTQAAQAKARELAALGRAELEERIVPIERTIADLELQLGDVTNHAIRLHADLKAEALRAAAREYLRLFGQVQWSAALLAKTPQAFQAWPEATLDVPIIGQADCPNAGPLRATLNPLTMRAGGAHEYIDLEAARAAVQQQLADAGIPI